MHKYVIFLNINQFRVKTQNCVELFVFILRMLCLVKEIVKINDVQLLRFAFHMMF